MRTWGRWTGTLLDDNKANIATKRKQLAAMIKAMNAEDKKAFEKILGSKLSITKPDEVAIAIQKASVKPANRIEMAKIGVADDAAATVFSSILGDPSRGIQRVSFGDEVRKLGNALAKYLDGQKEAPSGPPERARIRRVMSQVLVELQTQFPSLTMSDLQALLWYPEKRLYDAAKTADEGKTGYEDNEAPDYANAAADLARAQGIPDDTITNTIKQVDDELSAISNERAAGAERGLGNLVLRQNARRSDTGTFQQSAVAPGFYSALERSIGAIDADYITAVERGDTATAQRMVDEAARAAGYNETGFHGLGEGVLEGSTFDVNRRGKKTGAKSAQMGFFFASQKTAETYAAQMPVDSELRQISRAAARVAREFIDSIPAKYRKQIRPTLSILQEQLDRGEEAFMPDGDLYNVDINSPASFVGQVMDDLYESFPELIEDVLDVWPSDSKAKREWASKTRLKYLREFDPELARLFKEGKGQKPVLFDAKLKMQNPLIVDFKGKETRPETYADIIRRAIKNGHDSAIIRNTYDTMRGEPVLDDIKVVFDPAQIKSAEPVTRDEAGNIVPLSRRFDITSPKVFEQAAAGPSPRGAFDPRSLTLMLNKGADMSTFPHEMSHFYLTMLGRMASSATADPSVRADMDTLLSWFGVAGATPEERIANWNAMSVDQQRQYHEQFAYSFELYLFEGKSPSLEMQGVFDRFAAYLKRVYKSIRDELNATYKAQFGRDLPFLTPEIRGVMDRMLASDEQIKRAEAIRNMMPMFQTQEQAGMSDTEWTAYQAMQSEATQASITDLSRASIRQMQWLSNARSRILREMQAEHDERRKEIKSEVSREVAARPAYRATRWFRSGEFEQADGTVVKTEGDHKINKTLAFEIIDAQPRETMIDYLNLPTGIFSEEGANPDEVAQMMGFTSGDQMLRALVSLKPMREEIDAETDKRLTAERGELNTLQAREAAIASALHNEARARFVATELRFVAKATQPVRVMLEAARQVAAQIIGDKTLRDLKPNEFMAAESRAAKDASNAYSKEGAKDRKARYGNISPEEVVVAAKRAQLMQNQLAAEATRVGGEVVKAVKYLRNILSDANRKRMGADAADQIANILERFELRPMSRDEALRRATLATWITAQRDAGLEPDISPEVENEAFRVSYRDLTVQQFRDVVDAIKQIEYVAKNAQKLLVAARKAEFEAARDDIVASIETHAGDRKAVTRTPTTKLGKTLSALKGFATAHLKAAAIVRILDGGVDGGPLWQYLIRSSNERSDMETTMRAEATKFLSELFAPLFKMGRMGGAGVYFPTIDRSLNREARIAIALNMGNAGNIQRLLDGEGWSMEQIQPVLESLTQAEWDVVQGVWDYMESYRPKIAEKERRIYGKEPAWVEPQALTVKTAEGNEITLRGGYYPIKYDPMASMRAETMAEADEARRDLKAAGIAATTRRSFTKSRVREVTGRPLMYSLVGMYSGINDVIHDLSWHEWLIDANRLMRSDKFDNSVRTRYGPEYIRQLKDWIKDVAAGENQVTTEGERMLSWMRQNVSAAGLGFNIVSAAMQVTGFTNSFVRVGTAWVGRGIASTISNPKRAYALVSDKSEFMRNRSRTQFRELNELRNMVQDQSRADRTWRTGVYFLMMRMQQVVDVPTWIGAYEKALFEGREDADAVALADQAVIDSQGGGQLKDLSKIERGGPGLKLFTIFYSFMNTVYNQSKVLTMTEKNKGKLAARLIMLWVVPVVLNRMLKDALTPGDDDNDYWSKLPQRLAEDQLSYLMGSMVGLREFSEIAKITTGGKAFGYTGPSGVRKVGDVIKFAEQASQGEFDTAFRKTAINLIGDLSGAPSAQINRMIDGIDALVEGKTSNPLAPLTGFAKNR
jgi:hypothetical protein